MAFISSTYARKANKKLQLDGPLFRGRYKAILVESDSYFLKCVPIHPSKSGRGTISIEGGILCMVEFHCL